MSFFLVVVVALIVPFKVMLHWPTCNADSHNACFSHEFADMLHLWIAFKNLQRVKHCKYRKKIVRNGVLLERFFAQHRIIASWRCTLTSVTPPLNVVHQYIYFSFSYASMSNHTPFTNIFQMANEDIERMFPVYQTNFTGERQ